MQPTTTRGGGNPGIWPSLGLRAGRLPMGGGCGWRFIWGRGPKEEGFRDLKGQGFGLDRHRLRTGASLSGWLWLLALGVVLLLLLGAGLRGKEWLTHLLTHPERQSLFGAPPPK